MKKLFALMLTSVLAIGVCMGTVGCNKSELTFGKEVVAVNAQMDILTNMSNGSADVGVMDSIMAGYYMNNSSYKDTMKVLPFYLSEEEYGIGAKKGNDALIGKINEGIIALAKNGVLKTIGDGFGLTSENLVTETTANPQANATDGSWNKIVSEKKLIIGYTVFAPIAYTDNGVFTGYDIELAKAVVNYLNETYNSEIEIEFLEIDWDQKENLLTNGTIDLVWNGMTITDERKANMSMSIAYLSNKQAIIIMKSDESKYELKDLESFKKSAKDVIVYVESGSAAEEVMKQK